MEYQKITNLLENTPNQPNKLVLTHVELITLIVKLNLKILC